MRILITGGAGFIGSTVVRTALAAGHEVIVVDALTYAGSLYNLNEVSGAPNYAFIHADINDRPTMDRILFGHRPDAVIHLAAESHVDRSISDPSGFLQTNIMGTGKLLEAVYEHWCDRDRPNDFRFLHVSTDEVFGALGPQGAFNEDTRYAPNSPYAASKAAADHLVRAWGQTYGLPVQITHSTNNYGPRQFPEKLIPVIILKALSGRPIPIYGNGENVRDWLHVQDHADALLTVLQHGEVGRSYNIGSANEVRNIDIAEKVCLILDAQAPRRRSYLEQITHVRDRPGHDFRYALDCSRISRELGWAPSIEFTAGLESTVKWYLENSDVARALSNRKPKWYMDREAV